MSDPLGLPPPSKIQSLRAQGWSYRRISDYYNLPVGTIYELGHSNDVIDLAATEARAEVND